MNRKPFASRLTAVAFLGLVPAATGACGFIFSHAPPDSHEQMEYFTCTESNAGPILDVIWGGLNVLAALAAVTGPGPEPIVSRGALVAYSLSWASLSGAAAGVGFSKSRRCRAAKRALVQRQRAQGPGALRDPRAVEAVVQAVVISPATDTLAIGERLQLMETAHSSSGAIVANRMFTWGSSNDAVASVSNAGLVTAHKNGTVVIAANTDNVVGTANIVVVSPR